MITPDSTRIVPANPRLSQHLWAKSYPNDPFRYHPLWCHLLDVAAVCEALRPRFGGIAGLPDTWLPYLAALHDIGKADAKFQGKAPDLVAAGIPIASEGESRGFRHEARSRRLDHGLPQN